MNVDGIIMIVGGLAWLAFSRGGASQESLVHGTEQARSTTAHRKSGKWGGPCLIACGLIMIFGFRKDGEDIATAGSSRTVTMNGVAVTIHREYAGSPNAFGWYPAESTEGVSRIRFPGPFLDVTGVPGDLSKPKFHGMVCETDDGLIFEIGEYLPRPGYQIRSPHDIMTRRSKSVINEPISIHLAGHEAQAFSCELEDGTMGIYRYIKLADRVVLLEVVSPIGREDEALDRSSEFFDSLQIRKPL